MTPGAASARRLGAPVFGMLLCAYFGAQLLVRVGSGNALEWDEAEQVLFAQRPALGYSHQPPLYTWIQTLFFAVFGRSVFALALLKNLLLAATFAFTFALARRWMSSYAAAIASLAMLLLPQIGWESQVDRTHTVLATCLAAVTLRLWLDWLAAPGANRSASVTGIRLGAAIGLGLLSKYSFALFVLALAGASLAVTELRTRIRIARLLTVAVVAGAVFAPHAVWVVSHWSMASEVTLRKMDALRDQAWLGAVVAGLASLLEALLANLMLLLGVFGLLLRARLRRMPALDTVQARLLAWFFVLVLAALVAVIVLLGAREIRGHWLQPYLFLFPTALMLWYPELQTPARLRATGRVLAVVAALILVAIALRVPLGVKAGRVQQQAIPYQHLAARLRQAGFRSGVIAAASVRDAGNLALHFPRATVRLASELVSAELRGRPLAAVGRAHEFDALRDRVRALRLEAAGMPLADAVDEGQALLAYRFAPPGAPAVAFRFVLFRSAP